MTGSRIRTAAAAALLGGALAAATAGGCGSPAAPPKEETTMTPARNAEAPAPGTDAAPSAATVRTATFALC